MSHAQELERYIRVIFDTSNSSLIGGGVYDVKCRTRYCAVPQVDVVNFGFLFFTGDGDSTRNTSQTATTHPQPASRGIFFLCV